MTGPVLIVFAGLPGTGKTTLARMLAERLDAVYLRIDSAEQAIARSSLKPPHVEDAGYEVCYALAEDNLRLGRTVVADSVNALEITRRSWWSVGERAAARTLDIEVICSDKDEHRRRLETRQADIPGHVLPTWQEVIEREYDPWSRAPLVIDTAERYVTDCIDDILSRIS